MKKIKTLSMLLLAIVTYTFAEKVEDIVVEHSIPHRSYFKLRQGHPDLRNGLNLLGKIIVKNNTLDGFQLIFQSENGGQLAPTSTIDGAIPINYTVKLERVTGTIGTGISENLAPKFNSVFSNSTVLDTMQTQSSPTDISYNVYVTIQDTTNALNMAGEYHDTITVTYRDI